MELSPDDLKTILHPRKVDSHKGDFGYLALVGGSLNYSGAIRLASMASAALISGAGIVSIATPKSLAPVILPLILEETFFPLSEVDGHLDFIEEEFIALMKRYDTIAIGMGIGDYMATEKAIAYLLRNYQKNLLIDADGLNALARLDKSLLINTQARVILTPHKKEFSRLSGLPIEEINADAATLFAKKHNCIVLLKGHTTSISDGQQTYSVTKGGAGMAKGGSGDVLSGIIGALLYNNADKPLLSAAVGAYLNGLAGEIAEKKNSDITMRPRDTVMALKDAIEEIRRN